jgi:hypothetical protein
VKFGRTLPLDIQLPLAGCLRRQSFKLCLIRRRPVNNSPPTIHHPTHPRHSPMVCDNELGSHIYRRLLNTPHPHRSRDYCYPGEPRCRSQHHAVLDIVDIQTLLLHSRTDHNSKACETCRARKQKCDEQRPKCGLCQKRKLECRYREPQPTK